MADRGFTINDMLKDIGIELNIPPFMEGRSQLPAKDVQEGRRIASVRIHVERAIGRMKNFAILQGTFPISMSRIINQVVCVCVHFLPTSCQHWFLLRKVSKMRMSRTISKLFQVILNVMKSQRMKSRRVNFLTFYLSHLFFCCCCCPCITVIL